jgi:uncharacterized iron-regulated membrane protein
MTLKKIVGKLHLWLGFTSGLLVFIIAITGCLYAFQAEISDLTQTFRFVEDQEKPLLPPSRLKAVAEENLPGKHVHAVLFSGSDRAAQVIFYNVDPDYYDIVYVNPYTADVLKVKDMHADFFHFILDGHFYLWLPDAIGQPIVATACLVFLVMIISGFFLWWPRKKKDSKQRFRIKWKARWRRVNYDLHNVLGFYAFSIALILALTGLVWGFQWYAKGLYAAVGGEKSLDYFDPPSDKTKVYDNKIPAIDRVFDIMRQQYPSARTIEVHPPYADSVAIAANANPELDTYWKTDYRYYDQYTLKEISVDHIYGRFTEAKASDKLLRMNYDIHTGAVLGFPGKLLAFLASLICASLPVTGTYIWWGRRNKKQKAAKTKARPEEKELSVNR